MTIYNLPCESNRKSEEVLSNPGGSRLETLCRMFWRRSYIEKVLPKKLTYILILMHLVSQPTLISQISGEIIRILEVL